MFRGRPNTIKTYSSLFKTWIEPYFNKGTKEELYDLYDFWKNEQLSPKTINILLRLYKNHSKDIDIKHLVKLNNSSDQEEPIKALNKTQAKKLIDTCKSTNKEFLPVLLLGLHAGLRKGEIFGLKKQDIDYFKGTVIIRRSETGPTKNGKSRIIPLSADLEKVLLECDTSKEGEVLFKSFNPNPTLRGLCKRADVPSITFHSLRHTFATLALESGLSPKSVQKLMGHSTLSTTINIYWNSLNEKLDLDFLP